MSNPYNYEVLKYQCKDYKNYFVDELDKIEKSNKPIEKEPETNNKIIGKDYYETYYLNKTFHNHKEKKDE